VGIALGRVLGVGHSYWIALTAVAALQANNVTFLLRRSLHRLSGTIAGVAIGGIVFAAHPTLAVIAIVATAAQFAGEVFIRASYGLAIVFVTVVALSIYDLGVPDARIAAAVGARVLDTLIGVALVVVLRLLLWWRAAGTRLPQVQARTLRATADVFRARWAGGRETELRPALRRLEERLLSMRTLTDDAVADAVLGPRETRAEQISLAIDELAVLGLGIPFGRPPPAPEQASALVGRLDQLARTLAEGSAPGEAQAKAGPVDLPAYPRTRAATELLAAAIAGP
jgi:uncharacterized membrane protein YccC